MSWTDGSQWCVWAFMLGGCGGIGWHVADEILIRFRLWLMAKEGWDVSRSRDPMATEDVTEGNDGNRRR